MKTWNSQLQSCNILVYWFFLQSIICIALLFYIEHYLVAIHYSSIYIYIYIPHGFLKRSILKVCETISKSQHRRFQSKSRRYWKFKIVVFSMFDIWELQQKNDSLVCVCVYIYTFVFVIIFVAFLINFIHTFIRFLFIGLFIKGLPAENIFSELAI